MMMFDTIYPSLLIYRDIGFHIWMMISWNKITLTCLLESKSTFSNSDVIVGRHSAAIMEI